MFPPVFLSEFSSALVQLALIIGVALILPYLIDRRIRAHRVILLGCAAILAARYGWWRATETLAPPGWTLDMAASWSLFGLELLALLGNMSAFLIMTRWQDRSSEADRHGGWWGDEVPRVAILIATYNEDLEVLERTIVGAKSLRHTNKEVLVLDDGKRDWLRDYCEKQGVRYLRRADNRGSKAGNVNHALARLAEDATQPDFVAILDADFVPHHGFLSRSLALFHAPDVGLVQTPQHFFNADPIQNNLGITRSYPDEQRFFFDHMQPSRDGWGIAFCCGTSSVTRWTALQEVGGLPTDSVTEDFMLTLALQDVGWRTVYLAEPLTEGLAPEGLKEYITQRARWCLGLMQITRSSLGPFAKNNLRLRDRWSVIDSVFFWGTTFPFRIAALVYPLLYWFFNATVVDAGLADVISHFGTYYLSVMVVLNILSRGMVVPILNDVSQLIAAIPISRAAFTGLVRPKGHPFAVTAKGGERSRIVVQWHILAPFALCLALTLAGLTLGIVSDRFAFNDAGDGKAVILFWSLYNIFVLAVTILACIELPRRERHIADRPERVHFIANGKTRRLWMTSLTLDTARLRGAFLIVGTTGCLDLQGVGSVKATVIAKTVDGARVLLTLSEDQRDALFLRFYASEDIAPGVTYTRGTMLLHDVFRRLSFSRGPR